MKRNRRKPTKNKTQAVSKVSAEPTYKDQETQCYASIPVYFANRLNCKVCGRIWITRPENGFSEVMEVSGSKYCRDCKLVLLYEKCTSERLGYNPYDLRLWYKKRVIAEMFWCCKCKSNASLLHTLSKHPDTSILLYCFKYYIGHQFCRHCYASILRDQDMSIVPEYCCRPKQSRTTVVFHG